MVTRKARDIEEEAKLTGEIGKAALREAWGSLRGAVSSAVDDALGRAERELESARARRGLEAGSEQASPSRPAACPMERETPLGDADSGEERARRELIMEQARERRARKELEAMRAALARGEKLTLQSPPEPSREAAPFEKDRQEREERARQQLRALQAEARGRRRHEVEEEAPPSVGEAEAPSRHDPQVRRRL